MVVVGEDEHIHGGIVNLVLNNCLFIITWLDSNVLMVFENDSFDCNRCAVSSTRTMRALLDGISDSIKGNYI